MNDNANITKTVNFGNLDKGSSCTISALQNHFFKALEKMFRIFLLKKQDYP